ncbi:hypothetical protein A2W24_05750 [Microgenomates group bacterium RBG_16_45_19]|nr:MAG: hypothetical protein A2W24_05750 [Microgenomates group bacterium RBG_16_45_19]
MKILIIEDEIRLAQALKTILVDEGYQVTLAFDGPSGLAQANQRLFDLMLLDLTLPGLDGISLCQQWRRDGNDTPIIMLTARDTTTDRVMGLDAGADDYLVKPFAVKELLARIRAVFRRQQQVVTQFYCDDLSIDTLTRLVKRQGQEINLTATEYKLIKYLAEHQDQVVTKEAVRKAVWGKKLPAGSKTVDVYIGYLRHKIDKPFKSSPPLLHTIKGRGYRLGIIKSQYGAH